MIGGRAWRFLVSGLLLGAATFSNYLAVFTAGAVVVAVGIEEVVSRRGGGRSSHAATSKPGPRVSSSIERHFRSIGRDNGFRLGAVAYGHDRASPPPHPSSPPQGAERGVEAAPRRSPTPFSLFALLFGFLIFIPADHWWFLAQRSSRPGQFPPFALTTGLARLAVRSAGAILGGLPLYVSGPASTILAALLALLLLTLLARIIWRWRGIGTRPARRLFALAALAPPVGLLLLGFIFNNTPIEIRYLTFSTPFLALLLADALPACGAALLLTVQAAAIVGLMIALQTMQPASAAARSAAALVGDGVVLLPRGNDGVGVVGAFAIEAPPTLPVMVVDAADTPVRIRARIQPWHRVVLALLEQDAASRAACDAMRTAMSGWREVAREPNIAVYERTGN
jgi:hypothetical protein